MTDEHPVTPVTRDQVDGVWIDRQPGSGSLDRTDSWAKNTRQQYENANDGRSNTNTTLYWKGSDDTPEHLRGRDRHQLHRDPEDRRSWDSLAKKNDGVGCSSRRSDNFNADVKRWVQTFSTQLNLTAYQKRRVAFVVDEIDLSTFGSIPAEHVILGAITLVVDEDTDADPESWCPDDWIIYRDDFESMMDTVQMERDQLWTVRKRVHHDTDIFNSDPV